MNQTDKLIPCPFCGHTRPKLMHGLDGATVGVFCDCCRALVIFPDAQIREKEKFEDNRRRWVRKYNQRA